TRPRPIKELVGSAVDLCVSIAASAWLSLRSVRPANPRLRDSKRLLIVRSDEIGDFVMFTPFLRELSNNLFDTEISLLVRSDIAPLAEGCPYIDELIVIPAELCRPQTRGALR